MMSQLDLSLYSTYSIVAQDPETGRLGVAVQTHQMSVGSVVLWLLPGIGAIATQSLANISFGPIGLRMLKEGIPADKVIAGLVAGDDQARFRQIGVVDVQGRASAWTGENCIPEAGHFIGDQFCVQANMMDRDTVIPAMAAAYQAAEGEFSTRLMAALFAAQENGGDIRGMQSAAIKIVEGRFDQQTRPPDWETVYDLRVDEHSEPLLELDRLCRLRRAQLMDREGDRAIEAGKLDEALDIWAQARDLAPELEELPFWQAITLADEHANLDDSTPILRAMLQSDPRKAHWIDLIRRIQVCGLLERPGAGDELIAAIEAPFPD